MTIEMEGRQVGIVDETNVESVDSEDDDGHRGR
jgi:hypothetical protein